MQRSTTLPHALAKHMGQDGESCVAPSMEPHRTARKLPHATKIPKKLAYIYLYAIDMAYITLPETNESPKALLRCLYVALHTMAMAVKGAWEVRIMLLQQSTNWSQVWLNLHTVWISEDIRSVWFTVIHDIIRTNERLVKLRLRHESLHPLEKT
jgi:hypothetical protein